MNNLTANKVTREYVATKTYEILAPLGMSAQVDDLTTDIMISPDTRKTGKLKAGKLDGMQIIYNHMDGKYEVSEYQAGAKQNELHIYANCKTLKSAITEMLKGNKRKPIEIWD